MLFRSNFQNINDKAMIYCNTVHKMGRERERERGGLPFLFIYLFIFYRLISCYLALLVQCTTDGD